MGQVRLDDKCDIPPSNNTERLFVYGLLTKPIIQRLLIGRNPDSYLRELMGFTLFAIIKDEFKYPVAVPSRYDSIWGDVLQISTTELDGIEAEIAKDYALTLCKVTSKELVWIFVENPFLHEE